MTTAASAARLPRRDWILLPLIAILTALAVLVLMEGVSRLVWPEDTRDICISGGDRPKINCVGRVKAAEGPWVEERFNECGYRATGSCAPLPAGRTRIAAIGSSSSWGHLVPFDKAWSVTAAGLIGKACGETPDIQSLGGLGSLNDVAKRLPEAIALKPTLVALAIAPFDVLTMPKGGFNPDPVRVKGQVTRTDVTGVVESLKQLAQNARATTVAQAFAYRDPNSYATTYLHYGDKADFMRPPFTPAWQERIAYVEDALTYMAARLKAQGIPLMLVFVPQQAQADIVGADIRMPGVDANALNDTLRLFAGRHGILYADGVRMFAGKPDTPEYFYRADGHLDIEGNGLLGRTVAGALLAAPPPGLCPARGAR